MSVNIYSLWFSQLSVNKEGLDPGESQPPCELGRASEVLLSSDLCLPLPPSAGALPRAFHLPPGSGEVAFPYWSIYCICFLFSLAWSSARQCATRLTPQGLPGKSTFYFVFGSKCGEGAFTGQDVECPGPRARPQPQPQPGLCLSASGSSSRPAPGRQASPGVSCPPLEGLKLPSSAARGSHSPAPGHNLHPAPPSKPRLQLSICAS